MRSVTSLFITILSFLSVLPLASPQAPGLQKSSALMFSVAPLFIENETFSSTVHLVNEAQNSGWINLMLFDLAGNQIASAPEYFGPVSERTFHVRDLMNKAGVYLAAGSVRWGAMESQKKLVVLGQLSITHHQAGTYAYLDEEFTMPEEAASGLLQGVVEGERRFTVLALSNSWNKTTTAIIDCISQTGDPVSLSQSCALVKTQINACQMEPE